jgi:hypothetical protein
MKKLLLIFALWAAGSYGIYRLHVSPWWIVAYGLGSVALASLLVWRATKKPQA